MACHDLLRLALPLLLLSVISHQSDPKEVKVAIVDPVSKTLFLTEQTSTIGTIPGPHGIPQASHHRIHLAVWKAHLSVLATERRHCDPLVSRQLSPY